MAVETVEFVLLLLGAYILGAVPAAYLVAKWSRGIDIRQYGSSNVGASNVLATVSKRWAIPVTVFDLVKGMVVVYIAQLIGLEVYQQVTIGMAAIVGHNWPVFLRFSGGRGVLTTAGVLFVLAPWLTLILVAVAFLFIPFRQLSLGTLVAMAALPLCSWFLSQPFGIKEPLSTSLGSLAIFLLVVIRRLTAPKTSLTASVPPHQLLLNRLLFDRDIRDRKAWLNRQPEQEVKEREG
jgi:glycerol-3-phosphate acyltransferase PlsY